MPGKLPRPYIPQDVREAVIDRQMREAKVTPSFAAQSHRSTNKRIRWKLEEFFGCDMPIELHHRPALVNRPRDANGDYNPPANDPEYLAYVLADDHDIETRVRGQHGQYSDLALRRKNKRIEAKNNRLKRKWPKRNFRTKSR
jgi:hypothetical protein